MKLLALIALLLVGCDTIAYVSPSGEKFLYTKAIGNVSFGRLATPGGLVVENYIADNTTAFKVFEHTVAFKAAVPVMKNFSADMWKTINSAF